MNATIDMRRYILPACFAMSLLLTVDFTDAQEQREGGKALAVAHGTGACHADTPTHDLSDAKISLGNALHRLVFIPTAGPGVRYPKDFADAGDDLTEAFESLACATILTQGLGGIVQATRQSYTDARTSLELAAKFYADAVRLQTQASFILANSNLEVATLAFRTAITKTDDYIGCVIRPGDQGCN